ncbi:MAG: hypothetical protein U0R27_02230 [Candidatus Nanopelagicales bacterium]
MRDPDGDRTDGRLTLAATDRRLAVRRLPWEPLAADQPIAVTIPGRGFTGSHEGVRRCRHRDGAPRGGGDLLSLTAGSRQTGLRLMDSANFPKFRSPLPTQFVSQPEIEVGALKEALRSV